MDPAAALRTMRDETEDLADRIDAGRSLQGWLRNGGYVPTGLFTSGESYGGHQAANAVRLVSAETITLEMQS